MSICIHCQTPLNRLELENQSGCCFACYDPDDNFDSCSDCQSHDICADFGCEIKNGILQPDVEGWGMPLSER